LAGIPFFARQYGTPFCTKNMQWKRLVFAASRVRSWFMIRGASRLFDPRGGVGVAWRDAFRLDTSITPRKEVRSNPTEGGHGVMRGDASGVGCTRRSPCGIHRLTASGGIDKIWYQ
jgi:hypothetical protein